MFISVNYVSKSSKNNYHWRVHKDHNGILCIPKYTYILKIYPAVLTQNFSSFTIIIKHIVNAESKLPRI